MRAQQPLLQFQQPFGLREVLNLPQVEAFGAECQELGHEGGDSDTRLENAVHTSCGGTLRTERLAKTYSSTAYSVANVPVGMEVGTQSALIMHRLTTTGVLGGPVPLMCRRIWTAERLGATDGGRVR